MSPTESPSPGAGERERRLDALYSAELASFVELRDRWAREVVAAEGKEAAAAIRGLAKPNLPAWVVNRLAFERTQQMEVLRDAGERLREAQQSGDGAALQAAQRERGAALERLLESARELLEESVHAASTSTLEKVRRTLETVAVYGRTGRLPTAPGRLTRELEPPGFEVLATLAALPARPSTRGPKPDAAAPSRRAKRGARSAQPAVGPKGSPKPAVALGDGRDGSGASRAERERAGRRAREKVARARDAESAALERLQAVEAERRQGERELAAAQQEVERLERVLKRHRNRQRELEEELEGARQRRREAEAGLSDLESG